MAVTDDQLVSAGIDTGLLLQADIDQLRVKARRERMPLLSKILAHYRIPLSAMYRALAEKNGLAFLDLLHAEVNPALTKKMPASLINRKQQLVVTDNHSDYLVIRDPHDRSSIDAAQRLIGKNLPVVMADPDQLRLMVKKQLANSAVAQAQSAAQTTTETDLIELLDRILRDAYLNRSSDVHFLTEESGLRVRLRIDGKLRD